ncbi:hypothetical protein LTR66_011542 [Elasticomyces elasticus]|nr:hypothetical protein LTR66_011542 [Elasticomyces elasticus]
MTSRQADLPMATEVPTPERYFDNAPYDIVKLLPSSSEGEVELLRSTKNGKMYVLKTSTAALSDNVPEKPKEARILLDFLRPHANIVRLYECLHTTEPRHHITSLFMEYCSGGDLQDVFHRTEAAAPSVFPPTIAKAVFLDIAKALAYIHYGWRLVSENRPHSYGREFPAPWKPILHRDIKPANIFLRWPRGYDPAALLTFVLGDFGLAAFEEDFEGAAGTPCYLPPETREEVRDQIAVLEPAIDKKYPWTTTKSDIWTLGASLYQFITGEFAELSDELQRIDDGIYGSSLSTSANDRPSAKVLLCCAEFRELTEWRLKDHGDDMKRLAWVWGMGKKGNSDA